MKSLKDFVKNLVKDNCTLTQLLYPFRDFLCLSTVVLEDIQSIDQLLELYQAPKPGDGFNISNPLFTLDCKSFFVNTTAFTQLQESISGCQLPSLKQVLINSAAIFEQFKTHSNRIIRCVGYYTLQSIFNGVQLNINFQLESVKSDKKLIKETQALLQSELQKVVLFALNDPFEPIKTYNLMQLKPECANLSVFMTALHMDNHNVRGNAIKQLLLLPQGQQSTEQLLIHYQKLNMSVLDPLVSIQVQILQLLQLHFTQQQILELFPNISHLIISEQKQLRTAVYKLKLTIFQLNALFTETEANFDQIEFIATEMKLKCTKEEYAEFTHSIKSEIHLNLAVVLANINDHDVSLLKEGLAMYPKSIQYIQNLLPIEDLVKQSGFEYLLHKGDLLDQLMEEKKYEIVEKTIPNSYPSQEIMRSFLFNQLSSLTELRLGFYFLLKLKVSGIYDYSLFDSYINNFTNSSQDSINTQEEFDDAKIQKLQVKIQQIIELMDLKTNLLKAFPKTLSSKTDIGQKLFGLLKNNFIQLYELKYDLYEHIDNFKTESTLFLIQAIDDSFKEFVKQLENPEQQLDICVFDFPVLKKTFISIINKTPVSELFQVIKQQFKSIQKHTDTKNLKVQDLENDLIKNVSLWFKTKDSQELKKEQLKIAKWGMENGLVGLGKGMGNEAFKMLEEMGQSKK
ncbi:Conserved_hypothetical protein [Hexamita inflata]|uniref:Uncharacterized protein n=1 Tax=Hexamita inflata TaxID=28002 RepID=A0AA86UEH3_9EUKA|nr:Conserved hypothetical protein [Hexamita inflata]